MSADEILTFWFGTPETGDDVYSIRRKLWFRKNPEVDQQIRDQFLPIYEKAAFSSSLDDWQTTARGALALIIVLDQFPRHLFRNNPQAFATDGKARAIAKGAIANRSDQQIPPLQQHFIYMPLEHSEDLDDQMLSVALFRQLAESCPKLADAYDYALRHKAVIESFGRFPHRNAILGRNTTPDEAEFLKKPGSSF